MLKFNDEFLFLGGGEFIPLFLFLFHWFITFRTHTHTPPLSLPLSSCLTLPCHVRDVNSLQYLFFGWHFLEHLKNEFPRKHSENDITCVANHEWSPITYEYTVYKQW